MFTRPDFLLESTSLFYFFFPFSRIFIYYIIDYWAVSLFSCPELCLFINFHLCFNSTVPKTLIWMYLTLSVTHQFTLLLSHSILYFILFFFFFLLRIPLFFFFISLDVVFLLFLFAIIFQSITKPFFSWIISFHSFLPVLRMVRETFNSNEFYHFLIYL